MNNSDTDIIVLISLITLLIAENVEDNDELNVLSNVITSIGENLAAIAAQRELCASLKKPPDKPGDCTVIDNNKQAKSNISLVINNN